MRVTITKGVYAGKSGTAVPAGAIGPVGNRTFIVRVTLDDGTGQTELPLSATSRIAVEKCASHK